MTSEHLKISVVTVCYNAAETIEETMLSVLNPTYPNIEYIIIDGGSTDGTVDIIKKYANRLAYWVSEPDKGIYDAMNKGIKVVTGEYVNFMNAGDSFFTSTTISDAVKQFDNYDFIGGIAAYRKRRRILYSFWKPVKTNYSFNDVCHGKIVNHQSSFIRKRILSDGYDLSYKIIADELLFINKIAIMGNSYKRINTIIALYDITGISNTKNIGLTVRNERMDFLKKNIPLSILKDYKMPLYKKILRKSWHIIEPLKSVVNRILIYRPSFILGD